MADENKPEEQIVDTEMAEQEQVEEVLEADKIIVIKNEDHTLGNPLRYIIMKNPDVEFCGYSIPHPSEAKMNVRIQTYGETTAFQALQKGLRDLVDLCNHTEALFRQKVNEGNYSQEEP
ncbi:hypothetical protein D0Z00_004257 [Geotrichum galactomycetum]|uniref:Uncharacterized protein n=1 Tax=Geotrichum galactomycetum TaxID=27317 RepID=A0ACB6UYZ3_9ASCO|nr:hypothetical protein D0Z00_004257 [Geotrichum candidum]